MGGFVIRLSSAETCAVSLIRPDGTARRCLRGESVVPLRVKFKILETLIIPTPNWT
jgi:hypothetical protein